MEPLDLESMTRIPLGAAQLEGARRYRAATKAAEELEAAFLEGVVASIEADGIVRGVDLDAGVLLVDPGASGPRPGGAVGEEGE